MKKITIFSLLSLFLFFIPSGCLSQEKINDKKKTLDLKPLRTDELVHFSIVDKVPFENDCINILNSKKKTKCLEKSLRNQILKIIDVNFDYEGEMYLFFTVDKNGAIRDVLTKGYPASEILESKIVEAVSKIKTSKGVYKEKFVNVRCYTRVYPNKIGNESD